MTALANGSANGHSRDAVRRLLDLDADWYAGRTSREAASAYSAGESGRMNPVPRGVDPLGTGADYHYRTERNYFLMVERGRNAVRNHPLVEQGINRLIANLRLGDFTLDVDSGDAAIDEALKDKWLEWTEDKHACDYEQQRTFHQLARQSFFSQVQDGDVIHLPLVEGSLQTFEAHHIRSPWGHRPTGSDQDGIIHGVEVVGGRTVAYWITPESLTYTQSLSRRGQARRYAVHDDEGHQLAFWLGFTHRFFQRRGISRLSPPRDAMTGFDDLNYANIKSALRRALISYLMQNTTVEGPVQHQQAAPIPQAGDRYVKHVGLGMEEITIEQLGEPAQVFKVPKGWQLEGWNADMPPEAFFEHASLMLTMLAVNLELPLSFLLLDGSRVNFHGGRMVWDQVKLRLQQLQNDQIQGLWNPTYEWKLRQWSTPGSPQFDAAIARAIARAATPLRYKFRAKGWPYVKPLEDAAGEDLAEKRNLRSLRDIVTTHGVDHDEHMREVIGDRAAWARHAIEKAKAIQAEFPEANIDVGQFFRELWYGNEQSGVQLSLGVNSGGGNRDD